MQNGFTIIEVVLVLAIGRLIFLTVFIALPNLQRSQRNLQRKQDMQRVYTAVENYFANNNKMPYTTSKGSGTNVVYVKLDPNFVPRYIDENCQLSNNANASTWHYYKNCGKEFTSPSGNAYTLCTHTTSTASWGSSFAYGPCLNHSGKADSVIEILPYSDCAYTRDRYKLINSRSELY